jgi:hypothetical protein
MTNSNGTPLIFSLSSETPSSRAAEMTWAEHASVISNQIDVIDRQARTNQCLS